MDLSPFLSVLQDLGVNISASAVYDFLRRALSAGPVAQQTLATEFDGFLRLHGVTVRADTVLDAFARKGLLTISQSTLYAQERIVMGSGPGGAFVFGNDSVSRTDKTAIHAQGAAQIVGTNAAIVQGADGSISFFVGKG